MRLFVATILAAMLCACGDSVEHQSDATVLTIVGAVETTNRGGRDDFQDALLFLRQIEFNSARTFGLSELGRLPQHEVEATYAAWGDHSIIAAGPSLRDVLGRAGANGRTATLHAIDGYAYELDLTTLGDQVIVATHVDGTPLSVGGRGPLWLVMPQDQSPGELGSDEALVWGLYLIEISN